MKNRELNLDNYPTPAELYALKRSARGARAAELSRLKTVFWKNAAASMPASVRSRYMTDIAHAERMELALDGVFELVSRLRALFSRGFNAPRGAH